MAYDVLLRGELIDRCGGRRAAAAALREGQWCRLLRGAYVRGDATVDLALRCRAVQRLLPEHAVVADRCLLWLLGVDVLPPAGPVLEVVVPRGAVPPRRAEVLARTADVPARDRVVVRGVRCLRPARAAADLLRRLPLPEAVVVADAVQHARLCTAAALQEELVHHAGLRGVRQAHRVLELSDARAESPPESRVRLALVLAGLRPVPQYDVHHRGQWLARVDLAFPELRIAVEYDGRAVHGREDVCVRDRQRQNALARRLDGAALHRCRPPLGRRRGGPAGHGRPARRRLTRRSCTCGTPAERGGRVTTA